MFGRRKVAMILAEFLGTAMLTFAILAVLKTGIGLTYFVAIAAGVAYGLFALTVGVMSGGHFNPAVTLGLWSLRKIQAAQTVVYITAQFLGALAAGLLLEYLINEQLANMAGRNFAWRVFVAELVGTFVFSFGVAAAVYQQFKGIRLAFCLGGSLFLGMLAAGTVSVGLVNPALAAGVNAIDRSYMVAPFLGAIIGVNLYNLLHSAITYVPADIGVRRQPVRSGRSAKRRG